MCCFSLKHGTMTEIMWHSFRQDKIRPLDRTGHLLSSWDCLKVISVDRNAESRTQR